MNRNSPESLGQELFLVEKRVGDAVPLKPLGHCRFVRRADLNGDGQHRRRIGPEKPPLGRAGEALKAVWGKRELRGELSNGDVDGVCIAGLHRYLGDQLPLDDRGLGPRGSHGRRR